MGDSCFKHNFNNLITYDRSVACWFYDNRVTSYKSTNTHAYQNCRRKIERSNNSPNSVWLHYTCILLSLTTPFPGDEPFVFLHLMRIEQYKIDCFINV